MSYLSTVRAVVKHLLPTKHKKRSHILNGTWFIRYIYVIIEYLVAFELQKRVFFFLSFFKYNSTNNHGDSTQNQFVIILKTNSIKLKIFVLTHKMAYK